jgi:hypothetical protein
LDQPTASADTSLNRYEGGGPIAGPFRCFHADEGLETESVEHEGALLQKLASAERHVLGARKIVERQRAIISAGKKAGRDTFDAERLLGRFERVLAAFEDDYRAIQVELERLMRAEEH